MSELTLDHDLFLAWADAVRRDLPWRATRDPWAILVSEVMLQQTQVDRVVPRWHEFLERWPDAATLARVELAEVLAEWQGLGYPRRARNLHRTAVAIADQHGGIVPLDLDALLALPGIGPYTARAVLVFAGERDVGIVDTNVGRILARWCGRSLRPREAQTLADALVPQGRSWAWHQGLFDLGASRCRPSPDCDGCPAAVWCAWHGDETEPDPASASAGVSRRQSRFAGSERELRGFVMRAAADRASVDELSSRHPEVDRTRWAGAIASLVSDGLVSIDGATLQLG